VQAFPTVDTEQVRITHIYRVMPCILGIGMHAICVQFGKSCSCSDLRTIMSLGVGVVGEEEA
jgi:hypothetical protein